MSFAYADPIVETPAYIHWPEPDAPPRKTTLWVTLGVAAAVTLFSGASVVNAWSHMPDFDPNNDARQMVAYAGDTVTASDGSSSLVTFTPPADYNSNEAPVVPAVYATTDTLAPSAAVRMGGEAHFSDSDLAAMQAPAANAGAPCTGACTAAVQSGPQAMAEDDSANDDSYVPDNAVDAVPVADEPVTADSQIPSDEGSSTGASYTILH